VGEVSRKDDEELLLKLGNRKGAYISIEWTYQTGKDPDVDLIWAKFRGWYYSTCVGIYSFFRCRGTTELVDASSRQFQDCQP
jgi:hypothetical protein